MLLRRLTDFILSSRLKAAGVAFATSFLPIPGGNIGVLVAGLVTLRQGAFQRSLAFCASIAALLLGYFLFRTPETEWAMSVSTQLGFVLSLLTWVLVLVLRASASLALVTELGALGGLIIIAGLHGVFPNLQVWWSGELTAFFHNGASLIREFLPPGAIVNSKLIDLPAPELAQMVAGFSRFVTGLIVAVLLFSTLLQVVFARAWESVIFMPGELRRELYGFRPGWISASVAVILMVLDLTGSQIAVDMLPVMVLVFSLAGLSLLHVLFSRMRGGWVGLVLVYSGILMTFPLSLLGIAIPGLLDVWLDFRRRLNALKK